MPQAEATPATLEEAAAHGDMIFVEGGGGTDYRSIVYKTFALVQWVVANRQPKFILKTDDDAYVHTANLINALRVVKPLLAPLIVSDCCKLGGSGRGLPIRQSLWMQSSMQKQCGIELCATRHAGVMAGRAMPCM